MASQCKVSNCFYDVVKGHAYCINHAPQSDRKPAVELKGETLIVNKTPMSIHGAPDMTHEMKRLDAHIAKAHAQQAHAQQAHAQQAHAQHANLLRELVMSMQAEQRARREFMQGVFKDVTLTGEQRRRINVMVEALSITADARSIGESEMNDILQALD